ncbi:MAG: hypothetical protein ACRENI_10785 [Gemmatimonadaceae bacterium]
MAAEPHHSPRRQTAPYRPPVGIPDRAGESRRLGFGVSILVHALVMALLLVPFANTAVVRVITAGHGGGPGPPGGGGGGTNGTGGTAGPPVERLRYLQVAVPAVVDAPAEEEVVPAEEEMIPPPEPEEPLPPAPVQPIPEAAVSMAQPEISVATIAGAGGGTGSDGSKGTGPGSGGGTGSGTGTGTGSGAGPGTGGGSGELFPPTPIAMIIPPVPVPDDLRGTEVTVVFDVDVSGRVLSLSFAPTGDRDFDRKLRERLERYRFNPGVRADGTPLRMSVAVSIAL